MAKNSIGIGIIGTGFARTTQLPAWRACEGARQHSTMATARNSSSTPRAAHDGGCRIAVGE